MDIEISQLNQHLVDFIESKLKGTEYEIRSSASSSGWYIGKPWVSGPKPECEFYLSFHGAIVGQPQVGLFYKGYTETIVPQTDFWSWLKSVTQ